MQHMTTGARRWLLFAIGLSAAAMMIAALAPNTGADAETSVHLTAAGDFGTTTETAATLETIGRVGADAHLALGDLSYNTDPETAWCDFVKSRVGQSFPFQLIAGNHESNGQHGHINNFSSCLPNQIPGVVGTYGREYYYDMPQGNPLVRVINISAGQAFPEGTWNYGAGDARYQWTEQAIDSARAAGIPWVVVTNHYPCLSASTYGCVMPQSVFQLLQQKRVDLVLMGHDHAYLRTHQLASGAPGCPTIAVDSFDADCVVDQDNAYRAGAGTVFATVGTGGVPQRPIDLNDSEYRYFAKASGSNTDPTWGLLDLKATTDTLTGNFVRSTGGAMTDTFSVTKGPNQPPTAAISATVSGLAVTADGSGSSDPDGSIASYQWDFGDGTTATGAQPAPHQYRAAGTYSITLTVTDNAGSTASAAQSVTVTNPPAGAPPTPTGLTARPTGQTTIDLSWNASPGATEYLVLRNGTEIGRPTGTTFTDAGLRPETSYRYAVRAANRDGISPASAEVTAVTLTYVVSGDRWRFYDGAADPGAAWRTPSFADGGWKTGRSQLGYGDGDEATVLSWGSNSATKPITAYFRIPFDAGSSIGDVTGLNLRALVDDGAVVYLNGTEVWRFNLPTGTIGSGTRASRFIAGAEELQWRTATLPVAGLQPGRNVVAVEVHQDSPSSSDLSMDLELRPRR